MFGFISSLLVINKTLPAQTEHIGNDCTFKIEMATIIVAWHIMQAIQLKLTHATKIFNKSEDIVRVYKKERKLCGPARITRITGMEVTATGELKTTTYNINQIIPSYPCTID